jgi:serine/threonine-protein kinase
MQELLGGYRILETRAAAATGSKTPFYLAERDELAPGMPAGMRFLLKVLPREVFLEIPPAAVARESHAGMSIESSIAEFVRWARCYATLSHAALVRLFEVFEYEERIVLVLDPLETPPLATWLQRLSARTQVLDDGSIAWIGTRLFGALSAAHAVRDPVTGQPTPIAHGAISPQCVLVSTRGDVRLSGYPWVATPTVLPPSRFHRAPEQARSGVTTARSDIYSACLLLWELYARKGAVPRTLAPAEIDARLAEPNLPPLEVLRPDLPPRLIDGLRRGLVPDERLRGATAGELLGLFQELSRGGEARLATTLRTLDDAPPSRAPSSRYPGARVTDELVSDAATVVGSHDAKTVAGDAAAYGAIPSPAAPLQATASAAPRPAPRPSETGMKAASPTPPRATPAVPRARPSQPGMQAQARDELAPKAAVPARTNLGKATLLGISAAGSEPPAALPPPTPPPVRPAAAPAGGFERLSAADLLAEAGMPVGDSEPPGKLPFGTKGPEPRTQRMPPQRPQPPAGRASPSEAAAGFQSSVKKAEEELAALGASKPLFVDDPSETEATTQLPALDENGAPSQKGADFLPGSSRDVALPVAPREPSAPWAVEPPARPQAPSAEIWSPAPSLPPPGPVAVGDPFAAPLPPPGQAPPLAQPFAPFAPSEVAAPNADDVSAPMPPPVLPAPPAASKAPLFMGLFAAVLLIGGAGAAGLALRTRPATGPKAPPSAATATASARVTATESPKPSAPVVTATPTPSATVTATPTPSATATAEPTTAPLAGAKEGILDTGTAASGRRVFVDGKVVGQTPLKQAIRCGLHQVKVGSSGTEKAVQIPCGGSVTVN